MILLNLFWKIMKNKSGAILGKMAMKQTKFNEMGTDELWSLHVEVVQLLQERIQREKLELEKRLQALNGPILRASMRERRAYPPVFPKFRNPNHPSETWSGRGKQPRWLFAQLKSGKRIDDFRIKKVANKR